MDLLAPAPLSVTALNALAKNLLEQELVGLWVTGEISNLTRAASGHYYFALKDARAQVRCALFKGYADKLDFVLREGEAVEISGKITLYEARGEYQIVVTQVRQTGAGQLYAAYEALKRKLAAEGLFDEARKKTLPEYPRTIGIITSPAAAALRDVVTTLRRRMSNIAVIVYPTAVQGKGSEQDIARAIHTANERNEVDVLIVCRGGGSIEDLWAFNEEVAVRAVAASRLPVVCGVGHETDFTLCDFAADVRAPTPTAAAELTSPAREALLAQVERSAQHLVQALRRQYFNASQHTDRLARLIRHPREKLPLQRKRMEELSRLLHERTVQKLHTLKLRLNHLHAQTENARPDLATHHRRLLAGETELHNARQQLLLRGEQHITRLEDLLEAVSPQKILQRGFSVVTDTRGKIVSDNRKLRLGQNLHIRFADGETDVVVTQENQQKDLFD
ncbi:MAG: exodeoxyribonuclease VII large subunit [Neisseria sp.]|nr:exodeoxyribonuclease VII large subunit [Neisseria sp.]